RPRELPRADVVGVRVAGVADVVGAAGRQRQDDQVVEHTSGVAGLERPDPADVAVEAEPEIDLALLAEGLDRLAGRRVDRRQEAGVDVEQPAILPVGALTVVDAAIADSTLVTVRADVIASDRSERDGSLVIRMRQ